MGCKICKPKELGCLTCIKNINPKEPFCFEKCECPVPYAMVRDGKIIGYETEKKYDKTYPLSVVQDLIDELQEVEHIEAIKAAAGVLVDSVEKYVKQECSRSTLLSMKDKLKELLDKQKHDEK